MINLKDQLKERHPNLIIDTDAINSKDDIQFICKICGYNYELKYRAIYNNGCPYCNHVHNHKLCNKEYGDMLTEKFNNQYVNIEPYVDAVTKIKHKCLKHNIEFLISPSHMFRGQGCKNCTEEKKQQFFTKRSLGLENFKSMLSKKYGDEFTVLSDEYINNSKKMRIRHNVENPHDFFMTPNSILQGQKCAVCRGMQVHKGYNDFNSQYPNLSYLLENIEDGYKYSGGSNQKVNWKCPDCGNIMNKSFQKIIYNGIACKKCADRISYPNKMMYAILSQLDYIENLKREYRPDWCTFSLNNINYYGIYDFYFEFKDQPYIVEMDGGLGHGQKVISNNSEDLKITILKDRIKDEKAQEKNIKIIRIDCNYIRIKNRLPYIKNNIINSPLKEFIDFDKFDWDELDLVAKSSLIRKCSDLWNQGFTVGYICKQYSLHASVVNMFLLRGVEIGICNNYTTTNSHKRSSGHKVRCVNTGQIFDTIVDASKFMHIDVSTISRNCRHINPTGGKDINGNTLCWEYYREDDYGKEVI